MPGILKWQCGGLVDATSRVWKHRSTGNAVARGYASRFDP